MTLNPCSQYEQITTSYLLCALEYNVCKPAKELNVDVTAVICTTIHHDFFLVISMLKISLLYSNVL